MAKTIIIYSPQAEARALIGAIVADLGAQVVGVESAERLLSLASELRPSLIIMLDIAPLRNGRNIASRLRKAWQEQGTQPRRTAIFAVTWQQSEQCVLSLLESGIDQYLTFPISIERLRHKACQQIAGRELK
ncbi:MAG: response regulator [Alistipes sp.]|nr:response regulator [Alistipes sp.]